jgi:hypothetical protein
MMEGGWWKPLTQKNRLPMKKSNVRFFHGEPVFSNEQPIFFSERVKMRKYAFPAFQLSSILVPHSSFHHLGATGATGATGASTVSPRARV